MKKNVKYLYSMNITRENTAINGWQWHDLNRWCGWC